VVALLGLEGYSQDQLTLARQLSPALDRYLSLHLPHADLHARRHLAWSRCALATIFKTASPEEVCEFWSQTADELLTRAWEDCGLLETESILLAFGKQGARELNLSSDIDVMVVSEGRDLPAVEKGLRKFQQLISHASDAGFCFRLDFDLRPGGKLGPLITTPSQFQDYYWSQGETWERLAMVRLRPIVGSKALEKQTMDLARRFSFRKFLDFTLLDDLKALRAQVHQKGFTRKHGELHLKLEVGGIRDIELFVHSLLILNGGKLVELQTRSTSAAIHLLKAKNLLPAHEADLLNDTYWYFRQAENLVQAIGDRQTHSLPENLPSELGAPTLEDVRSRMFAVDKIVSSLLGAVDTESTKLPADEPAQIAWLKELGFSDEAIEASWGPLMKATALSHKNDRDERARQEFLYSFSTALASNQGLDRNLGLSLLVDFVKATRAKASFFSLLLRTPGLIEDLARLFCLSPYLSAILTSRPELLDHFILQVDEGWAAETDAMLQQMSERKLLTELWAANQFLVDKDLKSMFARITATADSICTQLLKHLQTEYPESRIEIVTLGKWAGLEMGLRSDLDFVFITPDAPNESDMKVARRLLSRLTDPTRSGSLYDLDLRLRPSGQSGALLVGVDKLHGYWRDSAKPWERQAYLRARPLNPDRKLQKDLLIAKPLSEEELNELKDIRVKLLRKSGDGEIDIKYAPGGMLDIEFVAQTAILAGQVPSHSTSTLGMIEDLAHNSLPWKRAAADLSATYLELRKFEQMLQLSAAHKTGAAKRGQPLFQKAAALMGAAPDEAWKHLTELLERSRTHLNTLDPTGLKL